MSIVCPVCQRVIMKPMGPSVRTTSWGDCACSDDILCVAHQCGASDAPRRPRDEVLQERAEAEHARRMQHYQDMKRAAVEAINAIAAYKKVAELLARWESERERTEEVARWNGSEHDRDLAQEAAATLYLWDELHRALDGK